MRRFLFTVAIILFSLAGCVSLGMPQTYQGHTFKTIDYGIYNRLVETTEKDPSSPKGVRTIVSEVEFTKKTTRIPMKLGTSFGIAYRIEVKEEEDKGYAEILVIRSLPKTLAASSGGKTNYVVTKIKKPTNRDLFSGFTLEEESDLLPGTWSFIIIYNQKIMIKKDFEIYDEEAEKKAEEEKKEEKTADETVEEAKSDESAADEPVDLEKSTEGSTEEPVEE